MRQKSIPYRAFFSSLLDAHRRTFVGHIAAVGRCGDL